MGLAATRAGARQIVNHNHVTLNGKKMNIPSHICNPGDVIVLKEKARKNVKVLESLDGQVSTLEFVKFDKKNFKGEYVRHPERNELNQNINESLIVEWYNRLV